MKVQTFIFAHSPDIVLDYIHTEKCKYLQNVRYLLLGNQNFDSIRHLPNITICRELPDNREDYNKFVSYTGWYSIWKNNLVDEDTEYVNLFEYDINLSINFDEVFNIGLRKQPNGIFYTAWSIKRSDFLFSEWCEQLIKTTKLLHNVDILDYYDKLSEETLWTNSTNVTFDVATFINFMNWFEPYFQHIGISNYPGHEYERAITIFTHLNNKNVIFLKGIIEHLMVNSHGMTQFGFSKQYQQVKNKLLKKII